MTQRAKKFKEGDFVTICGINYCNPAVITAVEDEEDIVLVRRLEALRDDKNSATFCIKEDSDEGIILTDEIVENGPAMVFEKVKTKWRSIDIDGVTLKRGLEYSRKAKGT